MKSNNSPFGIGFLAVAGLITVISLLIIPFSGCLDSSSTETDIKISSISVNYDDIVVVGIYTGLSATPILEISYDNQTSYNQTVEKNKDDIFSVSIPYSDFFTYNGNYTVKVFSEADNLTLEKNQSLYKAATAMHGWAEHSLVEGSGKESIQLDFYLLNAIENKSADIKGHCTITVKENDTMAVKGIYSVNLESLEYYISDNGTEHKIPNSGIYAVSVPDKALSANTSYLAEMIFINEYGNYSPINTTVPFYVKGEGYTETS